MLDRPPGGTTIRRPGGLMGTSSGVGGPTQKGRIKKLHDKEEAVIDAMLNIYILL